MRYLETFELPSANMEEGFLNDFRRTCFSNYYPFRYYLERLDRLEFEDITILCGSNGSGKSTLLNIIAEKLKLKRDTPYNKTYFFDLPKKFIPKAMISERKGIKKNQSEEIILF